jgi:PAS domain S-box-containing protein
MKILVVDDNPDNIDLMVIMLKSQKFEVRSAFNGLEALDILRSEKIDLIISDILMPVMDGFQLCRECKLDEKLKDINFIFYTATYIDSKDEEFALSLGAQKFIRKPQEPDVFLRLIKEVIENSSNYVPPQSPSVPIDEKEVFQLYSERLVRKLEKKNHDLEIEIANHKITEAKLQESEERFSLAVEGALDGLWDWNLMNDTTYFSEQFARMFGYEPDELPNTSKAWSDLIHPNDRDRVFKEIDDYFSGKVNSYDSVFRATTKENEILWINARGKALFDKNRMPYRFVCFYRDITKIKEYEIALRIAKEKAEESDRLKTAFLANISHEIRTPMNGIKGFINIIKKTEIEPQEQEQYLCIVEKSCNQLLEIITDIVEISKLDSGQIEPDYSLVSIPALINNVYSSFSEIIQSKPTIQLKATISTELTSCECVTDEEKLTRILEKLLTNAIKFTNEGYVEVGCKLIPNYIQFYVKDTGIGIAKEFHELVFDSFRQVETAYSKLPGGTGLGLAIAKANVELLGGKIWVESEPNHGAVFYFNIPYKPDVNSISVK